MGVLAAESRMDEDAHGTERKHGWRITQKERESCLGGTRESKERGCAFR